MGAAFVCRPTHAIPVAFEVLATCAPSVETAITFGAKPWIETEDDGGAVFVVVFWCHAGEEFQEPAGITVHHRAE